MKTLFTIALLALLGPAMSQEVISLANPSFEDTPHHSKQPSGWVDCGFALESPPDIQPSGDFNVRQSPHHGKTYLGMVVRDNETWEMVGQRLRQPLKSGQCYNLSLFLCRSEYYESLSRLTRQIANYATPAKLRLWAGDRACDKQELLAETPLITEFNWKEYTLEFTPGRDYRAVLLEAYYEEPLMFPYNGNILLDGLSDIVPCVSRDNREEAREIPLPETEEALAMFLEERADRLLGPDFGTANLGLFARAMQAFPDKRLVIALRAETQDQLEELRAYYQAEGYDPEMIHIGTYDAGSRLFDGWLWDVSGHKVMMRLEDR
ncbi:MAG: hypothetical protein KDD06_23655 [Phaeodactylibacter sp.]|nr:hypothetical protein [Phaeodactylibacter sp.]MCB9287932.1 hypothetical protein [Lewinellaceae bacterium]